jgi:Tol biopolymer transport system component
VIRSKATVLVGTLFVLALLSVFAFTATAQAAVIERVSVSSGEVEAQGISQDSSINAYGSLVAFESDAANLVDEDTNGKWDVFVRDLIDGETLRVSVTYDGLQANGDSGDPCISPDGRYVAFWSDATNLVASDTNSKRDVFVVDLSAYPLTVTLMSVSTAGAQGNGDSQSPSMSAALGAGYKVAFSSDATNLASAPEPLDTNSKRDIYVRDLSDPLNPKTSRVSYVGLATQGDGGSDMPAISADGLFVAFVSDATNLVIEDTNAATDVFVSDLTTHEIRRVSVDDEGHQGDLSSTAPSISGDGRYVAFESDATTLVAGDSNGATDVFVYDYVSRVTTLASASSEGEQGSGTSVQASISPDGSYVAFASDAPDLVLGDTNGEFDVFVHDLWYGTTQRVSITAGAAEGNDGSFSPSISADGPFVSFASGATNFVPGVPGDANGCADLFVASLLPKPTISSLSDHSGPSGGENSVVITGTGFIGVARVAFGDTGVIKYTVNSDTQITVVVPPHAAGDVQVQVTAAGGATDDAPVDDYEYTAPVPSDVLVATQLTDNDYDDAGPQVSDDRVVWNGWGGSDQEIFTWIPGVSPLQVTADSKPDYDPQVSDGRLVWYAEVGSSDEIFTRTPGGSPERLTTNSYDDVYPQVSGDRVVWAGYDGHDDEIFTWTPTGGVVQLTVNSYEDWSPQVSGDRVVWQGYVGGDYEIFTWTPAAGTLQLTDNAYDDTYPRVSGDRVVWQGEVGGGDYEIFTWTPTEGALQRTDNAYDDTYPQVSGDRVVWQAWDGAAREIFTWTPDGSTLRLTDNSTFDSSPRVSGDRVVWYGRVGLNYEIFTWTSDGGAVQLTTNTYDDYSPEVSGDRVVWAGYDGHDDEIFTASPGVPTISSLSPNHGPTAGANTVTITGKYFANVAAVTFGSYSATNITVVDTTHITATAPAQANSVVDVMVTAAGGSSDPSGATDNYTYVDTTRYEQTNAYLSYAGTWYLSSPAPLASGGSFKYTNVSGTFMTVKFTGAYLAWIGRYGPLYGKARVSVDGGPAQLVDLYAATNLYKEVWNTGPLASGTHTVVIEWTGAKNASATGTFIGVDAFDVAGALVQAPVFNRYQQTNSYLNYLGTWYTGTTTEASLGNFRYSNSTSAMVTIKFTGTYLAWLGKKSPAYGIAAVSIDGTPPQTIDLYSTTGVYQEIWNTGTLASGTHTITIWRTGTKNASASDANISVDAVDVIGTLVQASAVTRYQQADARLAYTGTWTTSSSSYASGGNYRRSSSSTATVTIPFYGQQLDLIFAKGPSMGKVDIYIDGGALAVTLDLYRASALYQQKLWSTGVLAPGFHTVKLVRNPTNATGKYINLDAIDVTGILAQSATIRYEQNTTKLVYAGTWYTNNAASSASGGSFKYSNLAGASVTVTFNGTYLAWITKLSPAYGKARVWLDGVDKGLVDLYSAADVWKQKVWSTGTLASGVHTVKIEYTGEKNASASNTYIGADAFDITGTLQ